MCINRHRPAVPTSKPRTARFGAFAFMENVMPEDTDQTTQQLAQADSLEPTSEDQPPHPGHAIIDEIISNVKVQHNPGWIRAKLEALRKTL